MNNKPFSKKEKLLYYNAIKKIDPLEEIVEINEDFTKFKYSKKLISRENIKPPINDEEIVRAFLVVALIKKYKYSIERIKLEESVNLGGSTGKTQYSTENDIIIMDKDNKEVYMFIEVKRPQVYISLMERTIQEQLIRPVTEINKFNKSRYLVYTSIFVPNTDEDFPIKLVSIDYDKYRKIGNPEKIYNEWLNQNKPVAFTDIPINYGKAEVKDFVKGSNNDLNDILNKRDVNSKWNAIWNDIWGGTVEDNRKFGEFNKILLAKIYDEREKKIGETYDFQIRVVAGQKQNKVQVFYQIDDLYKNAFKKYLGKNGAVNNNVEGLDNKILSEDVVYDIVNLLQDISLSNNVFKNIDILGNFYETVIREGFKQTKGLYLTSPNVIYTILAGLKIEDVVELKLQEGNNSDFRFRLPYFIDPSCGTGAFLVWIMKYVTDYVKKNKKRLNLLNDEIQRFIEQNFSDSSPNQWARDYIYGIEIDPILATASQINMILHGDGSTNIFNTDGLLGFDEYRNTLGTIGTNNMLFHNTIKRDEKVYTKKLIEVFDIVVSNPPFSAGLTDSVKFKLKDNFELYKSDSECLFFERYYQLLKQGGRLGVVLPEAFFAVDDYKNERKFLMKHFNIKAIVSMPNTTFLPHTPTLTSLLFAQKKNKYEEELFVNKWDDYESDFEIKCGEVNLIISKLSKKNFKVDDDFCAMDIMNETISLIEKEFDGMVKYPVISEKELSNMENWSDIRKRVKNSIEDIREWYVLKNVTEKINNNFINIKVNNIGYKRGKKGTKEKPNDLFHAIEKNDGNNKRILNIENTIIDIELKEDKETVVGYLRSNIKWD